jgi:hypothetical protein
MRSIEELRPIIQSLYGDGFPITYAQPLVKVCHWFWDTGGMMEAHGQMRCPPPSDNELWPIPPKAIEAGIISEEWSSYAKKVWNDFWRM